LKCVAIILVLQLTKRSQSNGNVIDSETPEDAADTTSIKAALKKTDTKANVINNNLYEFTRSSSSWR